MDVHRKQLHTVQYTHTFHTHADEHTRIYIDPSVLSMPMLDIVQTAQTLVKDPSGIHYAARPLVRMFVFYKA